VKNADFTDEMIRIISDIYLEDIYLFGYENTE